ncbi:MULTISPECIES: sulfurtransferase TusA family protein [unclassified Psychrobacter]|uniref:sulfurtransferase TusA family protein n=1 Tax=unclassified Psychrobacter TaxID=196806 RepID=UPI0017881ECF|nr:MULTISPECIES: sulfurtransferase TusA family protein [unclassified Psychrobacter]MBE0442363.1 sulfurtransferase TusA family protein [Psychrobacter sp. FME13]
MSADSQSTILHTHDAIRLSEKISSADQQEINQLLALLKADNSALNQNAEIRPLSINITRFVDGRGLACPMPLLKTKVALRDVANGDSLYVVATDANSQADITAFCRQTQLLLIINSVTHQQTTNSISSQRFDTIYHFIITKTDSN